MNRLAQDGATLDVLAGSLIWERTSDGIRVVIPARMSWGAMRKLLEEICVGLVALLGIFVIAGGVAYFRGLSFHTYLHSEGVNSLYVSSLGYGAGLCIAKLVPRVFGKTIVTLSPAQLAIDWNSRIGRSKEVFRTATIHSLRFVDRSGEIPIRNTIGQNEIQFGQTHLTGHFAEGVTHEEAGALIAKMLEICPRCSSRNEFQIER